MIDDLLVKVEGYDFGVVGGAVALDRKAAEAAAAAAAAAEGSEVELAVAIVSVIASVLKIRKYTCDG